MKSTDRTPGGTRNFLRSVGRHGVLPASTYLTAGLVDEAQADIGHGLALATAAWREPTRSPSSACKPRRSRCGGPTPVTRRAGTGARAWNWRQTSGSSRTGSCTSRPREATPERWRSRAGSRTSHHRDDDVSRDGHAVLLGPGRGGVERAQLMRCALCRQDNPGGARFCNGCGARLELTCPSCGHVNPSGSRFCNEDSAILALPIR